MKYLKGILNSLKCLLCTWEILNSKLSLENVFGVNFEKTKVTKMHRKINVKFFVKVNEQLKVF